MNALRMGVIGVGRMGKRHCRVFSNLRKSQLVGICDSNTEIGRQAANEYEAHYYDQMEYLLENVDAVCIATPTPFHYQQAMYCLEHGVHVLVEKPLAETLAQAEMLAQKAESNGLIVQVGHIERFNPAFMELKRILEEMPPLAIEFNRLSPYQGSNVDVDVVLDLMIHDTNLVIDLVGNEPDRINSYGLTVFSGMIDYAVAQLYFDAGPLITMTASRITESKVRLINVTCKEAYIVCDLLNKTISKYRCTMGEYVNSNKSGIKYRQESIVEHINVPIFEPLFLQSQHFVDCVLNRTYPLVTARDGYLALKLALNIRNLAMEHLLDMNSRSLSRTEVARITAGMMS